MEWWQAFKVWFLSLGEQYNVNPYIFGSIYIGAIPFFFLFLSWTVKNIKQKKPFVIPLLLTGLCFVSAYIYLIIVGKNIPVWVYFFIAAMILYGIYSTITKIRKQTREAK
jgi:hypothetical protein